MPYPLSRISHDAGLEWPRRAEQLELALPEPDARPGPNRHAVPPRDPIKLADVQRAINRLASWQPPAELLAFVARIQQITGAIEREAAPIVRLAAEANRQHQKLQRATTVRFAGQTFEPTRGPRPPA